LRYLPKFFDSGSKKEAREMLELAAKKGVKSYIEMLPSKEVYSL
jgi:D-arabinose 1-dehydrogenase-like Zn-dependent alcohol dehydrogenase